MRLKKETKFNVESLEGVSRGRKVSIWQYPNAVMIEIDGELVQVNRKKLIWFLNRKAK